MKRIVWLSEARDDLHRLHAFLFATNPVAAASAARMIVARIDTLERFPGRGRPWEPDAAFRELIAGPYVVRYRILADRIVIVRIWHGREQR